MIYCPKCGKKRAYMIAEPSDKLFYCATCGKEFIVLGDLWDGCN